MTVYQNREAFIPYSRKNIIELCIADGKLPEASVPKFRDFCSILMAYYHFKLHHHLEVLKENYAPFNPDTNPKYLADYSASELAPMETKVVNAFEKILEQGNYVPVSKASLQRAFQEKSLIELKTDVDFDEFDQMVCFCRGDIYKTIKVKKWFREVEKKIDTFARVAVLIKCKNDDSVTESYLGDSRFIPGKIYIYLYKNIPKNDIEFIFPNVKVSMTLKDWLMLAVPAIGAAVPMALKILPQLLLIIGVIVFITLGPSYVEQLNLRASQEDVQNIMGLLVAVLSLLVTFGIFIFKQYSKYKSKQIRFQKQVTETLFFKNIASNAGVFMSLIDDAEEEECKEIILVYYHLLSSDKPLTPEQLDDKIEEWMAENFDTKIDFDIQGPLHNLTKVKGKVVREGEEEEQVEKVPLLTYDDNGCCQVLPLDDAKQLIDYVWDNLFNYA
ncbi:MAG: TMEM143 family protein [Microcoleaceae cyanobacterium MO_207.B10]|nr:TMEM143 family protein [Microcoleaceae cyanobacterium MO_207.B10]